MRKVLRREEMNRKLNINESENTEDINNNKINEIYKLRQKKKT
jgi:hypothetical protein